MSVGVNPPKTPVTKGSNGIAAATVPNVCKMPGPPAPFVPTPLPNIGRSSLSPKGYTKKVLVEGKPVAVKGASFASQGDMASKGTGGGVVSSNTHGPTKFIGPGSMDVKFEGKNVQLLSDPMSNNNGPSGSPANSATLMGVGQMSTGKAADDCPHPEIVRVPALGTETRSTEELAQELEKEAERLEDLAREKQVFLEAQVGLSKDERRVFKDAVNDTRRGAEDKRFEAKVARDTRAKEVSVKIQCKKCSKVLGEFDVITNSGVHKECKNGKIDVKQFYKEKGFAQLPHIAPPGTIVHLAVPGGQRGKALKAFVRPGGRKMTNKGKGYNREIQEH